MAGMGLGVGYGVLSEVARYALLWAKWKACMGLGLPQAKIAETMQTLLSAEKDPITGLSTKGQVDTIVQFIDKTLDFAGIVDEAIATQMFVQMIQQSIAYAIHSSHAGSIGTVGNIYSGSTYLSGAETQSVGSFSDFTDRHMKAFLSAEIGQNIPTLSFGLMRGGNIRIEEMYRTVMRDIDSLLSEWNDLALSYYRHYHSMARTRLANSIEMKESVTERAYSLLESVANEHLARISEQLDTLEGGKAWWDATLISDDELKAISIQLDLERGASETNYDDYKTEILGAISSAITDWDTKISVALGDLTDNETKYSILLRSIFDTLFTNVSSFAQTILNEIETAVDDVCAYRNITRAIDFSVVTELGVTRQIREICLDLPDEESYTAVDIPHNGKWLKLIYTREIGHPKLEVGIPEREDWATMFVDLRTLGVDVKSFPFMGYSDVIITLSKRKGTVGEVITNYPSYDPDWLVDVLWALGTYTEEYYREDDRAGYADHSYTPLTEEDTVYVHVWLGVRNTSGETQTGTSWCKNLKALFISAHYK